MMTAIPINDIDAYERANKEVDLQAYWPKAIWALALGSFAIGTTEFLPAALLPTISNGLNVSVARAGLLISGYAIGVTVLTPILTACFSSVPRKKLLMLLMWVFILTNFLAALAPFFSFLLMVRFVTAFSHGVFFAVSSTVTTTIAPKGKEAQAIALLFTGLTVSMATVVPFGAVIGQVLGWRIAFAATAFLGLLAVIAINYLVPEIPASNKKLNLGGQLQTLKQPALLRVLAMTTIGYAGTFTTFTYLAPFLEDVSGFHPLTVTFLFALLGIGVTLGNFLGGWVADKGVHLGLMTLYGTLGASFLLLWFISPYTSAVFPTIFLVGILMFSPGAGLQMLALQEARRTLPEAIDVAAGMNQSAFNLGIAIGAFTGGQVIASGAGLAAAPLVSFGILMIATCFTFIAWRRSLKKAVVT